MGGSNGDYKVSVPPFPRRTTNKTIMNQTTDELRHYAIEVKPVGAACNLRCAYCYYLGKDKTTRTPNSLHSLTPVGAYMSDEVLDSYIQQVIAIHGRRAEIEFAWHGGEPTMAGISFYEKALAIQRKYGEGRNILNTLQTNGTLLTDDWCRFFKDNAFRIGLSIDGPEHLHNIYRKDARGEGTFSQVMAGLDLLRKHGVEFNTLTTVNAQNAGHAAEVYNFLRTFSDFMQFLPVVESSPAVLPQGGEPGEVKANVAMPPGIYSTLPVGGTNGGKAPFNVTAEAYGRFLCTVLDEWARQDVGRKFVQVIEAAIGNMTRRPAGLCVHESVCGHCGVIEKNGDLYRCDRYVFPQYRIGNIMDESLGMMMQTNRDFGEFKMESLPRTCIHCDVVDLCWGGCPKDRLVEKFTLFGKERHNILCSGYRTFFRYCRQRLPKILNPTKPII